jgi:hypothetical protein
MKFSQYKIELKNGAVFTFEGLIPFLNHPHKHIRDGNYRFYIPDREVERMRNMGYKVDEYPIFNDRGEQTATQYLLIFKYSSVENYGSSSLYNLI